MSRDPYMTAEHIAAVAVVPCPYCGAKIDQPCDTSARAAHPSRRKALDAHRRAAWMRAREQYDAQALREYPDGQPFDWQPMRWYRHVREEKTTWTFTGREGGCREHLAYVYVRDNGGRFSWSVELCTNEVWDAGYSLDLSVAQRKAREAYDDCVRACTEEA
jgi:hypothetical protein